MPEPTKSNGCFMSTNIARPRRVHHTIAFMDQIFHPITQRTRRFCPPGVLKMVAMCGCAVPRACWTQLIDKEEVGIPEPVAKDVSKKEAEG